MTVTLDVRYVPEAINDEEFVFVLFRNQIVALST